ncbi:MAG: GNAT family N-acetyltransferase [Gemmatimonadaceae bacterium]
MTATHHGTTPFHIRRATPADRECLVDIWWRSASATHTFLSVSQLEALLPDVQALHLELLDTWVLCAESSDAVGFLVLDMSAVDALFIAPEWLRRGGGKLLMRKARELAGPLRVDVNEQNANAIQFYLAEGFVIVGRSPVDDAGRPYPLLHLEEPSSAWPS